MNDATTAPEDDQDLARMLALTERGMGAIEVLFGVLRETNQSTVALVRRNRDLAAAAWTDPLTGLLNRRGLTDAMTREEARANRYGASVAVALLDVDGLKAINDRRGHLAGDAVLRAVGSALRDAARASDVIARFGGDEFIALLPDADLEGAQAFLTRARAATRIVSLPDGQTVPVRLAAGIATRAEAGSIQAALAVADRRLILDKRRGSS
jgi:diguanylate cyclase